MVTLEIKLFAWYNEDNECLKRRGGVNGMSYKKWVNLGLTALLSGSLVLRTLPALAQDTHTVNQGDTLYSIATNNGLTVEELMALNGLSDTTLQIGQSLIVSGQSESTESTAPTETSQESTLAPPYSNGVYTVQAGDTLSGIAATFGTSLDQLYAWNNLASSFLQVGDQLAIHPDGGPILNPPSGYLAGPIAAEPVAGYHTVTAGENLWDLSWYYGTTVDQLMAMNDLSSDFLQVGDVLAVPSAPAIAAPSAPVTSSGKSTTSQPPSGQQAPGTVHVVQAGDNLWDIANHYGITVNDLFEWNNLSTDYLDVGNQLYVSPPSQLTSGQTSQTGESQSTEESSTQSSEHDGTQTQAETNTRLRIRYRNGEVREIDLNTLPENAMPETHIVQEGENIWTVAEKHNVSAASLRNWNQLGENQAALEIGKRLFVSNPAFIPLIHEVQGEDTLASVAEQYSTTEANLIEWNNLTDNGDISDVERLIVSDPKPDIYSVQAGETLEQVAERFSVSVEDLKNWNNLPESSEVINASLIVSNPSGK